MSLKERATEEIMQDVIDRISGYEGTPIDELHNELYNTGYYIIGYYQAEQWLGNDVFEAMRTIKDYEMEQFGEVNTDLSDSEKVVNMYVYIIGEEVLYSSPTFENNGGEELTEELIKEIIEELS